MTAALTSVGTQQVSITIASGSLTGTASISAVGSGAYIAWQGQTTDETGTTLNDSSAVLTISGTTITATRGATGSVKTVTVLCTVVDANTTNMIKTVQMGVVSITTTSLTGTATVSAVTSGNTALGFLGISSSGALNSIVSYEVALSLSGTTITATRIGATSTTLNIGYCVIEYQGTALSTSVQRVSNASTALGTSRTSTISAVTTNNAFITFAGMETVANSPPQMFQYASLTNSTTVTLNVNTSSGNNKVYNFSVVDLVSSLLAQSVQRGTILLTAATSNTATITSSPTASTLCNWLSNTAAGTGSIAVAFFDIVQTNATTLTVSVNTAATGTGSYEAINFTPATSGSVVTWSASASLSAIGRATNAQAATWSPQASLSATGRSTNSQTATWSPHASLSATGIAIRRAVATWSPHTSLSATGASTVKGVATFSPHSSFSATGASTKKVPATWSASASLTAVGRATNSQRALWTPSASLTAVGASTHKSVATWNSSVTFSAIASAVSHAATWSASGSLSAIGLALKKTASSWQASATFAAHGNSIKSSVSTWTAQATFTAMPAATGSIASWAPSASFSAIGSGQRIYKYPTKHLLGGVFPRKVVPAYKGQTILGPRQ